MQRDKLNRLIIRPRVCTFVSIRSVLQYAIVKESVSVEIVTTNLDFAR